MQWTWLVNRLFKLDRWLLSLFWLFYSTAGALWFLTSPPGSDYGLTSLRLASQTHHRFGVVLVSIMVVIFPLMIVRGWIVRTRTEEGLNRMAQGVSSQTGIAFFRSLTFHLARALGADYVLIGKLSERKPGWMSTILVYGNGSLLPSFSYRLSGTPCEKVLEAHKGIFACNVRREFPHDPTLRGWEAESFAGTALVDSSGKGVGVLAVISRQPFKDRKFAETLLQVFAVRAAGELERQQNEEALRRQNRFYQTILNAIPVPVFYKNPSGAYLGCNAAFEAFMGLPKDQIVGRKVEQLLRDAAAERHCRFDRELTAEGGTTEYQTALPDKQNRLRHLLFCKSVFRDENGGGLVGTMVDITRQKDAEETARYLAHFDPLTGLPNQVLLTDRLSLEVAHSRRLEQKFALFVLDLDHFKKVNNAYGHQVGDELLKAAAERLSACLREDDTVARLGGDSFILLLPHIRQAEHAAQVAQKILDHLKRPFPVGEHEIFISASIGIAIYPDDAAEPGALMKHADTALNRAKEKERNLFRFFQSEMNLRAQEQIAMLGDLQRALEREEFIVRYQPQVEAEWGRLVGGEALLRWEHPEMGLVPPDRFIPLAEENGLILQLGDWTLRAVCEQLKRWQDDGRHPRVAVNLSARQFQEPGFYERIDGILQETGVDPKDLGLEITESTVMEKVDHATVLLKRLKLRGIHISIDDFGTGHCSLGYIKSFPVDMVKIDRSFVRDLPESSGDSAIVSAVTGMAHNLGIRVLAEGVETIEQRDFLKRMGCDEFQGFLYSEPVSADAFSDLLENAEEPDSDSLLSRISPNA